MPQDEDAYTDYIRTIMREAGVETVFTCASECDYQVFYPVQKTGLKYYFTTHPGLVDENTRAMLEKKNLDHGDRPIDIGYRARRLPFWLGRHGQKKYQVGERVKAYCDRETNLTTDISSHPEKTLYGDDWLAFLLRCRTVLGSEGGASLLDADDTIRPAVERYVHEHTGAEFEEVEAACFPGRDGDIRYFAISPRHFECAMTKTCQVLLEGRYAGIFRAGEHYIELKGDYSNLPEVVEKVRDRGYCCRIAENAYQDIVASGKYTYRIFANQVVDHIRSLTKGPAPKVSGYELVRLYVYLRRKCDLWLKVLYWTWYTLGFYLPLKYIQHKKYA
jgi:hypothetical protein